MVKQGTTKVKFMLGTKKVKKLMLGTQKVWSGASIVSYYDGDTLIGTQEIDEGMDVLRPNIDTTKSGYTLYGWGLTADATERVSTLVATGEPMTLYAMYIANTLTAVSNGTILDSNYVTGKTELYARASYNTAYDSGTFNLLKRRYQTATCTVTDYFDNHDTQNLKVGEGTIDGISIEPWATGGTSHSKTLQLNTGAHSLYLTVYSYDAYWQVGRVTVASLVLSNPIPWG